MKLTATTHHGDFREIVTLETNDGRPDQGTVERLLRATAYAISTPQDRMTRHVDRIVLELAAQGQSALGWTDIQLHWH